jgi:hypothetical protein
MGKLRKSFDCFQAREVSMTRKLTLESGSWPRSVCSAQEQGRTKKNVLPSTFIRSETESRFTLKAWID